MGRIFIYRAEQGKSAKKAFFRRISIMLLRSSSTPVIGSLLSSFSADSPNIISNHHSEPTKPSTIHHTPSKFSFHQTVALNISHNSSPISPSVDSDRFSSHGFRRAQSDGNLEGLLAYASCDQNEDHEEEDSDIEYEDEEEEFEENVERVVAMEGENVGLEEKVKNMSLTQDVKFLGKIWSAGFEEKRELVSREMHLAKGLGIGGGGGGGSRGRGEVNWEGSGDDGGENHGAEGHYKKLVEENPGNPLFLGNYAQFLYQTKRDLRGAEEYYSRAILADPKDGEVLAQYANLVWELHHDQDRALSYYERAVQAAPQDSHVHAAYANFLWETEEDEDEDEAYAAGNDLHAIPSYRHEGIMTSASA
ncbi:Tetratricopeptide repeat-like superfamily protein [Prunus dulcis]|uniref:Tetratricopeptide repeat-like superfamily protein n=1 Tax=Prunus dulcis TaxID=3755 RepID=A0A4Y1S282_PRUDU|nr:Tetratricopeptide repeat-like superfamily protein [Prunus dulcis]